MSPKFSFDRYLNIRSAYSTAWINQGQSVAFLTDITGTPQVWSIHVDGGWPDQLTFFKEKVWTLKAAPDGKSLVCTRDIGGNERYQLYLVTADGAEVRRLSKDIEAIYHFGAWSADSKRISYTSNERSGTHFDVYLQELETSQAELVYQTDGNFRVLAWSPDGDRLILVNEVSSAQSTLYILDLTTKKVRPLTSPDVTGVNLQVRWTRQGQLVFLSNQEAEFLSVVQMDVESGKVSPLFDNQSRDVEGLAVSPDGSLLAYTANAEGYSQLILYNLETGQRKPVPGLPKGVIAEPTFSADGNRLAFSVQSPQENLNIWTLALKENQSVPHKLTQSTLAGITQNSFVEPELIHYQTFDGRSIPAFFFRPQNVPALPACILYVHGGPASQILPDFDPRFQFFLSQGYAILAPNVRGSSGYGKTYKALDDVERRMDSVTDLKYAVEWLKSSGEVDPARIAVYGRSYGGFMVLSAITTYPDLWAAAVDVVGIANWVTFLENTGPWRRAHREKEYGSLETDRPFLESISPIHKVDQIQCPLLVIHGANDPRVPVSEADQIVSSLQERNHPVEYLRYKDEGHKIAKLHNRIDSFTRMAEFLADHLKS